eukprot:4515437-Prymnesium_polylepis.1
MMRAARRARRRRPRHHTQPARDLGDADRNETRQKWRRVRIDVLQVQVMSISGNSEIHSEIHFTSRHPGRHGAPSGQAGAYPLAA